MGAAGAVLVCARWHRNLQVKGYHVAII